MNYYFASLSIFLYILSFARENILPNSLFLKQKVCWKIRHCSQYNWLTSEEFDDSSYYWLIYICFCKEFVIYLISQNIAIKVFCCLFFNLNNQSFFSVFFFFFLFFLLFLLFFCLLKIIFFNISCCYLSICFCLIWRLNERLILRLNLRLIFSLILRLILKLILRLILRLCLIFSLNNFEN